MAFSSPGASAAVRRAPSSSRSALSRSAASRARCSFVRPCTALFSAAFRALSLKTPLKKSLQRKQAALEQALATLQKSCKVTVYTDSEYVKNGITTWIHGWKQRGWKTADKKPVKNIELWQRLDELNAAHSVQWRWVKGHAGDPGNERADRLANRGVDSVLA